MNSVEEGKWLLAVASFEATNSVFNISDENNSFSNSKTGRWRIPNYLEDGYIDNLKNLQKLRSQNDIELHVYAVRKRWNQIKIGDRVYKLADLDTSKKEILKELKSA